MGAPMARHLAKSHAVTVWNRSAEKAQALADVAKVANDPVDAARGARDIVTAEYLSPQHQ